MFDRLSNLCHPVEGEPGQRRALETWRVSACATDQEIADERLRDQKVRMAYRLLSTDSARGDGAMSGRRDTVERFPVEGYRRPAGTLRWSRSDQHDNRVGSDTIRRHEAHAPSSLDTWPDNRRSSHQRKLDNR